MSYDLTPEELALVTHHRATKSVTLSDEEKGLVDSHRSSGDPLNNLDEVLKPENYMKLTHDQKAKIRERMRIALET